MCFTTAAFGTDTFQHAILVLTELSNNKDKMVKLHVGIFGYSNQYLLQFSVNNLNFPCN